MATNMLNLDETAFGRVRRFVQGTRQKSPDGMYTDFLKESITPDLAKSIEWQTRGRETNPVWQEHCRGILMADSFYRVLSGALHWRNQPEHRPIDLINHVAYRPRHLTPVLSWEEIHKEAALAAYWRHISFEIVLTSELEVLALLMREGGTNKVPPFERGGGELYPVWAYFLNENYLYPCLASQYKIYFERPSMWQPWKEL